MTEFYAMEGGPTGPIYRQNRHDLGTNRGCLDPPYVGHFQGRHMKRGVGSVARTIKIPKRDSTALSQSLVYFLLQLQQRIKGPSLRSSEIEGAQ